MMFQSKKFFLGLSFLSVCGLGAYVVHKTDLDLNPKKTMSNNKQSAGELMDLLKKKVSSSAKYHSSHNTDDVAVQCLGDEIQFLDMERDVLLPIKNGLKNKDIEKISSVFSNDFLGTVIGSKRTIANARNLDGIQHIRFEETQRLYNKKESLKDISSLVDSYSKIDFAELVAEKYISSPSKRDNEKKMNVAEVHVRYDLRGLSLSKEKQQDRGIAVLKLRLNEQNQWEAYQMNTLKGERLSTSKTFFSDLTKSSKVAAQVPSYLRREAIRRGGYAMAVGDYNNDDNVDVFVATVSESVLLKGDNAQSFTKDSQANLENESLVKAAAFADFDNNGTDELLLVRFAPNEAQTKDDRSDILIYKRNNDTYEAQKGSVKFGQKTAYAMPLALADFNADNKLDFYVGFPGAKDFTTLEPAIQKDGLATQGVFYNQGSGTFKDDPYRSFASAYKKDENGHYDDLAKIFPHSALAADYNGDGSPDLIVVDDRGNLSPIYENKGDGSFSYSTNKIGVGLRDYGMGVAVGDLNNDGRYDFLMSSVNFNASKRVQASCETNWSVDNLIKAGTSGLRVFSSNKNKTFSDTTIEDGLDWVGEGAGGVTLVDYNNDGHQDIYLVNGLWSGSESDQSQDLSSYFVAASSLGILENDLRSELRNEQIIYNSHRGSDFKSLLFRSDSQSAIMDILSFFRGDIHSKSEKVSAPSLAGAQRNRLFRNNGDGSYTEVGYLLGVDSSADGYMASLADLDKDGNMDFILRNADPGYRKDQFPPVQILKNNGLIKNNSIILSLKGTNSNTNAVGAEVIATVGEQVTRSQLLGNQGTVQSERLIHIGLGTQQMANTVQIKWPSGNQQTLINLKKGFHKIVEPEQVKPVKKRMALK